MKKGKVVLLVFCVFQFLWSKAESTDLIKNSRIISSIDSLQKLCNESMHINPQHSIVLGNSSLQLANQLDDPQYISTSLILIGSAHLVKGEHHSALNNFYKALKISRSENLTNCIIASLDKLGIVYFRLGDFQNSLFYLTESLKNSKEFDNKAATAFTLNKIGKVYQKLKDFPVAYKYYNEALKIQENLDDETIHIETLISIAHLSLEKRDYAEALSTFKKTIEICNNHGLTKGLTDAYIGLGLVNEGLKKLEIAEENYNHALQLSLETHDRINVSATYYQLANLAFIKKNYHDALELNFKSYELALDMSAKEMLKYNYDLYSLIYSKLGDHEAAYSYLAKANLLRDLLFNENISRSLNLLQMAEEEARHRQMMQNKDLEIEAGKTRATFLSIILLLLIVLSVLIYLMYKHKDSQQKELSVKNTLILDQNKEIELQKDCLEQNIKELESAQILIHEQNQKLCNINEQLDVLVKEKTHELVVTNGKLKDALQELDTFIYKTSHDIRGPLARLMGLCNVALLDIKHKKSLEYFEMLNVTAKYLNSTLVRLLTVIEIKNNEIKEEIINFKSLIDEVINNNSIHEGFKDIRFDISIDDAVSFNSDPAILNLILHNLVENSVKYYNKFDEKNPFIELIVNQQNENIQIRIIDNGVGINQANLNLFEVFSRASNDSHAAGLGLYMIKICVEKLEGSIELVDNPHQYTEFCIQLPKNKKPVKQDNFSVLSEKVIS